MQKPSISSQPSVPDVSATQFEAIPTSSSGAPSSIGLFVPANPQSVITAQGFPAHGHHRAPKSKKSPFHIREVRNPGGSISHQLSGMMFGEQIREQFKTEKEALERKRELESEIWKGPHQNLRLTWLSALQVSEAEAAVTLIGAKFPNGVYPATAVAQYFVANFKENKTDHTIESILPEYLACKRQEKISDPQMRNLSFTLRRAAKEFPSTRLHEFTSEMFTAWLEKLPIGPKSWRNMRADLSAFFTWALSKPRQWLVENPLTLVEIPDLPKKIPQIISAQRAQEIMSYVETFEEGRLSLIFSLLLFAGIRPMGEIARIAQVVREGRGDEIFGKFPEQVFLDSEITKTGQNRWIQKEGNLADWIERYPPIPAHFDMTLYRRGGAIIRKRFAIPTNAMRHNFDSFYAMKHSANGANEAAGHDEKIAMRHYRNLGITKADLGLYWSIRPSK